MRRGGLCFGKRKMGIALPKIINDDELERVFRAIPVVAKTKTLFYTTLVMLGAFMGLRCNEAITIKIQDIDWFERALTIAKQKNGNNGERTAIPGFVLQKLKEHIKTYQEDITDCGGYLFFSKHNKSKKEPISRDHVRAFMEKIRKETGINKAYAQSKDTWKRKDGQPRNLYILSYHTFRHYYLTKIEEKIGNLKSTMVMGRHLSPQSAMRYQHTTLKDKREIIEKVFSKEENNQEKELKSLKQELQEIKSMLKDALVIPSN